MAWGIAEWYGRDIRAMSADGRKACAETAIATKRGGMSQVAQPECPFLSVVRPGATCNKPGGVCSIRNFVNDRPEDDAQPAAVCPNRFLELAEDVSVFKYLARELFGTDEAKVIKEIPFLNKVDADGTVRAAKAGRIDWVLVPDPPQKGDTQAKMDWLAIETQAVYFSGDSMDEDFQLYLKQPDALHGPSGQRRPDFRSSGAKRLAPQLSAKSPVMRRWGNKVVVIIDKAFFSELAALPTAVDEFDNADVVWLIMRFTDEMNLVVDRMFFGTLEESIQALDATRPVPKQQFNADLRSEVWDLKSPKVHDA